MEHTMAGQTRLAAARGFHTDAIAAFGRRQYDRALQLLEAALRLRRQIFPEAHPMIIATHDLIVGCHLRSGDKSNARKTLRHLLELQIACLGANHVEVELTLERLCTLAGEVGDWDDHRELTRRLWAMRAMPSAQRKLTDFDATLGRLALPPRVEERLRQQTALLPTSIKFAEDLAAAETPRTSRFLEGEWFEELRRKVLGGGVGGRERAPEHPVNPTAARPATSDAPMAGVGLPDSDPVGAEGGRAVTESAAQGDTPLAQMLASPEFRLPP